ncbi:MAG: hypothetical protein WBQ18_17195, partial [Solirubrobacteraceae bacterium]
PRNPSEEPLPGSVSNQNNEEAEPGHGGGAETRNRPAASPEGDDSSGGESKEGSQSTGSPRSAG